MPLAPHTWSVSDWTCPAEYTHALFHTAYEASYLKQHLSAKETYLSGDLATVVEVVQCEDPLPPSVLIKHHATLCDLRVHVVRTLFISHLDKI